MTIDADSDFDSGKSNVLPSFSIASIRYHYRRSRSWLSMSTGKKVVKWFEAILPISSATGPGRIGAQGSRMLHKQDPIRRQDRAKYTTVSGKRSITLQTVRGMVMVAEQETRARGTARKRTLSRGRSFEEPEDELELRGEVLGEESVIEGNVKEASGARE
ncbi:hypothetical protein L210DRAFT_937977 [Boletus edulis BED1]|uniref:Uncharacterized protein n=1 Tax=Boletus edulis BED1 TaxID=1328754 RepID=A0AAD4GBD6_BOLED|nr:hypothetical protein L210DRAFT_937977 [Boletus edulis BED1]